MTELDDQVDREINTGLDTEADTAGADSDVPPRFQPRTREKQVLNYHTLRPKPHRVVWSFVGLISAACVLIAGMCAVMIHAPFG